MRCALSAACLQQVATDQVQASSWGQSCCWALQGDAAVPQAPKTRCLARVVITYILLQVHYDRNAAQRTNVIDDQSDYFEIDSNAWLTDQVGLVAVCGLACLDAQCVGGSCTSELPAGARTCHESLACAAALHVTAYNFFLDLWLVCEHRRFCSSCKSPAAYSIQVASPAGACRAQGACQNIS